jgi:polyisoprenoid-binding protein YceI
MPDVDDVTTRSPPTDFLLGVIVGAAFVFVGFGVFGFRTGGSPLPAPSASPAPTATPAATSTLRPTPEPTATPQPTLSPTPVPTDTPVPTPEPTPGPTSTDVSSPTVSADPLAGTWNATAGSLAGYQVTIHVPFLRPSTVHGTTPAVTGAFTIAGVGGLDAIVAGDFTADLRQLSSGTALVDRQVASLLQVGQYPLSVFHLTDAVPLPGPVLPSGGVAVTLRGYLTLQGSARPVDLPAIVTQTSTGLTVAGAVDFLLSQYGIPTTIAGGIATVDDAVRFDYSLVLVR